MLKLDAVGVLDREGRARSELGSNCNITDGGGEKG